MQIKQQFLRYAIVGLVANGVAYLVYLALTGLGLGHKLSMSLVYATTLLQTFVFNKKWSFRFAGDAPPALVRYTLVYVSGYFINLIGLWIMVDQNKWPHQGAQAMMILVVATLIFLAQRYWVFPKNTKGQTV